MPMDSVHASDIHGVLVARHGRLVLEEYFHGTDREQPHELRSAAKSLTSTLAGAAMQAGVPLGVETPVYKVMNGGEFPKGLDARKRALSVQHLLTMSSGLDCDDSDDQSPGNEDKVQEQTAEPDWWKLTLGLDMIRDPGEKAVYCSVQPNLLGGVLKVARASRCRNCSTVCSPSRSASRATTCRSRPPATPTWVAASTCGRATS